MASSKAPRLPSTSPASLWTVPPCAARRRSRAGGPGEGWTPKGRSGRAFRLIGIGAHGLVEPGRAAQGDLFGGASPDDGVDKALDAVREKFGDDAIVRGRGFGVKLERQGPSKTQQVEPGPHCSPRGVADCRCAVRHGERLLVGDVPGPWRVVGGRPRDRIVFGYDPPAIEFEMTIDRRRAPGLPDRAPGAYFPDAAPGIN